MTKVYALDSEAKSMKVKPVRTQTGAEMPIQPDQMKQYSQEMKKAFTVEVLRCNKYSFFNNFSA